LTWKCLWDFEGYLNLAIVEAIEDRYKQVEMDDFLNIFSSAVSKIIAIKSENS